MSGRTTITTKYGHGLSVGARITLADFYAPWYVRLWRWLTRHKAPVYTVRDVTATTFTIDSSAEKR